MSRRKSLAITAAGLLSIVALLAGCSSAPLTDARKILANVDTSLKNLQSVHFHIEAGGQFAVGVQAAATDTPVITDSPAPSDSPVPSDSPAPSASGSAAASSSAGASASVAASGSAAASASAVVSASPAATDTPAPSASPAASVSIAPVPTPVYTALPVSLDGTTADGDIDYVNKTAHIIGGMPGLPGVSGELIVIDPYSYYRGYGGTKYTSGQDTDLAINPADSSQSLFIVQQVVAAASDASMSPTFVGMESEPSGSCYHVRVELTQSALSSKLANLSFVQEKGSGWLNLWITQNDFQLERLEFSTSDPASGAAAIRIVFSKWNGIAAIQGPAANQIELAPLDTPAQ